MWQPKRAKDDSPADSAANAVKHAKKESGSSSVEQPAAVSAARLAAYHSGKASKPHKHK